MNATRRLLSLVLLAALCAASRLSADGSLFGTITGRVHDESGAALPGATVELTSAEKGFRRTAVTDAAGKFNFALLPPGAYTIRVALESFEAYVSTNNLVAPEKTTDLAVSLKLSRAEASVEVVGETPLVDKENPVDTTTVPAELTDKLPIARAYQTVIDFAPGQNDIDGDGNPNARGAPDSGNVYLFDGVDTTDPTTGTFGANQNFDTIQEVVVSNAAVSAEYGRFQGGVFNVVTKTGTNNFHGTARVLATNDEWNSQNKGVNALNGEPFARVKLDETAYNYSFTLGGPVWTDKIFFFGAYQRNPQVVAASQTQTSSTLPDGTGQSYTQTPTFVAWQGKLTGQLTPSQSITFSAQADPFNGIVRDYWGAAADTAALTLQSQSEDCPWACIWQARYTGVFGANFSVEATYAGQRGGLGLAPYPGSGSPYFSIADQLAYNGTPYVGVVDRPRNQGNLAMNYFTTLGGHSHNFKVGVDYQDFKSENFYFYENNELFVVNQFDAATHQPILQPGDQWFQFTQPAPSISTGRIWGIYGLDRFELTDRLSFNLGVRADIQHGASDLNDTVINATTIAPRLFGTWDVNGTGKTLVSAGWGRYYEFLAQTIVDSIYSGVPQESNANVYAWDGSQWQFDYPIRAGGNQQPVNPNLKPSYVDEYDLSFQQQIGNTMAVAVRGLYRKWNNIVDDIKRLDDEGFKFLTPINFGNDVIYRDYKSAEITFNKRFSNNFQALASYTWSQARGNADRSYSLTAFTSQLLDYPNDTCTADAAGTAPAVSGPCPQILGHNRGGPLPWDVTNSVKLYGAYTYPMAAVNLTAAPSFTYFTGLPYQPTQNVTINGDTDVYYPLPQGSLRLPSWYQLNFSVEANFKMLDPVEIALKADIFNVTNQQPTISNTQIVLVPGDDLGKASTRSALNAPRGYQFGAVVRF
ncbi:MAG TPA: TonB-dependent receptor [Thermoanaerobaculia bacterium]|nr:TonB-dependent receptor [Thermoanaerobaculia bacterium]